MADLGGIGRLGWAKLAGDGKVAGPQHAFQGRA